MWSYLPRLFIKILFSCSTISYRYCNPFLQLCDLSLYGYTTLSLFGYWSMLLLFQLSGHCALMLVSLWGQATSKVLPHCRSFSVWAFGGWLEWVVHDEAHHLPPEGDFITQRSAPPPMLLNLVVIDPVQRWRDLFTKFVSLRVYKKVQWVKCLLHKSVIRSDSTFPSDLHT